MLALFFFLKYPDWHSSRFIVLSPANVLHAEVLLSSDSGLLFAFEQTRFLQLQCFTTSSQIPCPWAGGLCCRSPRRLLCALWVGERLLKGTLQGCGPDADVCLSRVALALRRGKGEDSSSACGFLSYPFLSASCVSLGRFLCWIIMSPPFVAGIVRGSPFPKQADSSPV